MPSCEEHNTEKSKEDEYLLYVLAMSLPSNELAKHQFLTKIMRAIQRRPKLIERLLTETHEVVTHDLTTDTWEKTIAFRPEENRLISIFTCIGKGLYFHEKHEPWISGISVLIEFMLSFDDLNQNERLNSLVAQLDVMLATQPLKGENQDVFAYQFIETDSMSMARLHFYGFSKISIVFAA